MFASHHTDKTSIIQALEGLMERLSAPDLTVAEAKSLHPRLIRLLEMIEAENSRQTPTAGDRKVVRDLGRCVVV